MSFVYIDSQGREVNIPSVDAVRLRIELGAIKDQTRFFDGNTGKWAPAAEHEIYRTLKRQLMEVEQGFVAPPPTARGVEDGAPSPVAADGGEAEGEVAEPEPASEPTDEDAGPEAGGSEEIADLAGVADPLEVPSDEDGHTASGDHLDEEQPEAGVADFSGFGEVDLAPVEETPEESPGSGDEEGASVAAGESFVTSVEDELMGGLAADDAPSTLDDGGLALEPSLAESFSGAETESPGPGGFDGPGTDSAADASVSDPGGEWGGDLEDPGDAEEGSDPFDSVWEDPDDHRPDPNEAEDHPEEWPAEVPAETTFEEDVAGLRSESPPPQRKLTKARTPGAERIVGIVALVAVLGVALFFGWRVLAPSLGGSGEAEITMPPLDQELVPRMRQLAGRASERMAQDMLALPERAVVPEEPSEDWLAGIYLAGASGYPNVPDYWSAIRDWVQACQTSENALFRDALLAQLDTANLAASDTEAIRDRALAGFQAAGADRRVVYDQMREVAERSLELHAFLLANEDQVSYEPAGSGVSRDPVLEAVPATEALGDEMWEMVASITNAMDALGYLDRIYTERLLGVFLEKLEATAIR